MYPIVPIVDDSGLLSGVWQQYISRVDQTMAAVRGSSATANRPVRGVWVGQMHYDTTLGQPIWAAAVTPSTVDWVDATGTAV